MRLNLQYAADLFEQRTNLVIDKSLFILSGILPTHSTPMQLGMVGFTVMDFTLSVHKPLFQH